MLQKLLLILLLSFSACASSGSLPKLQITVLFSDPTPKLPESMPGLYGYDEFNKKDVFFTYADSKDFMCIPPSDAEKLLNFIGSMKK